MELDEDDGKNVQPAPEQCSTSTAPETCSSLMSSEDVVAAWRTETQNGTMSAAVLRSHWRQIIPKLFIPPASSWRTPHDTTTAAWAYDDRTMNHILLRPLEQYIFGSEHCDKDEDLYVTIAMKHRKPAMVCGRVFKTGEPTYSCRECGADNTCVLCVQCFKQSEHRFHKYRMGTSGGGGCCDCGDLEAWKRAPCCRLHSGEQQSTDANSADSNDLSPEMQQRTRYVFEALLWYTYQLLRTDNITRLRFDDDEAGSAADQRAQDDCDIYCTILYNDETHTFDQVISTLTRMKLAERATELASTIDREGRTVVKTGPFQECMQFKDEIEKHTSRHGNKPLKVVVSHMFVVAHQMHCMKLLSWLEGMLNLGPGFRSIFVSICVEPPPAASSSNAVSPNTEPSILRGILLRDCTLWKSARSQWQRLLISGMLLEYEHKMTLARVFTKSYGIVIKDFIEDDHDHSFSISSMSVQLFTVPTLAHHLIEHEDVLFILLNAFMSQCTGKYNRHEKLEFERNPSTQKFKRAQYIIFDLRYLLGTVPDTWTDPLRTNFLHGMHILLNLLNRMQGMDSIVRQVGQHMEYEPEWESAFNLHIKLASCLTLVIQWCGSDHVVLVKMYRAVLKKLYENPTNYDGEAGTGKPRCKVVELANHSASCVVYDVSTKPISIHLPVSRLLAALHLRLHHYGLNFHSNDFQATPKPTVIEIMEPVLRCQVMIAQVHSGMWRRNGYALLNQLFYYHNVKCRAEMLDRDINILQMSASLLESDEFMLHLLHKFNLLNWASQSYELQESVFTEEDSMRQIVSLVEEFFQLLIVIVGERYVPGIGLGIDEVGRIKKEIIQYLCIKAMPHSELSRIVSDDLVHETTTVDDVIDELADFRKPSNQVSGKGVYELKPEFYAQYNVFYYHYTREELSKSEETQRKRQRTLGELDCCPPPALLPLEEPFHPLVNLLQCDVMLHLFQLILTRCNNLRVHSFSELQLHKVLHLIGYALHEEESNRYPFFKFVQNAQRCNILGLMNDLLECPRVEAHKDLLKWTIRKYRAVMQINENVDQVADVECKAEENESSPMDTQEETGDKDKERRAKLAAERRATLLAQMATMQQNFIKDNAELFEETTTETKSALTPSSSTTASMECCESTSEVIHEPQRTIALGPCQSARIPTQETYTCILCQEDATADDAGSTSTPLVLSAFVQQATVLCVTRHPNMLETMTRDDLIYLNTNMGPAPHTSTCGHVMHSTCWRKYFENVTLREHRRPYRLRHPASFDVDKQEFLCPLCECLSNTVLPVLVAPPTTAVTNTIPSSTVRLAEASDLYSWFDSIMQHKIRVCHGRIKCSNCRNVHCVACASTSNFQAQEHVGVCDMNYLLQPYKVFCASTVTNLLELQPHLTESLSDLFPQYYPELPDSVKELMLYFGQATCTKNTNYSHQVFEKRAGPMVWQSLAYTIHSIAVVLTDCNKPLLGHLSSRQRDSITHLTRLVAHFDSAWKNSPVYHSYAIQLLSILFDNDERNVCIMDFDSFGFLVSLTFAVPSLANRNAPAPVPMGGNLDWLLLKLVFSCHIVKQLMTLYSKAWGAHESRRSRRTPPLRENPSDSQKSYTSAMDEDDGEDDTDNMMVILQVAEQMLGLEWPTRDIKRSMVWPMVKEGCMAFLRSCCLFYRYLTDVPEPEVLTHLGGDTFENMCAYLGLPTKDILRPLFYDTPAITNLVRRWMSNPTMRERIQNYAENSAVAKSSPLGLHVLARPVYRLVELPTDYSDLINSASTFTCPNAGATDSAAISGHPTMCLVCGCMLCAQTYCCQRELNRAHVGASNYHAYKCGAGVGIFLRIRECEILLLVTPQRGCFLPAPYVDAYGETDQGLKRGNPLTLCHDRYAKLQSLWLSHGIPEEIARSIETHSHIVATQWNHL